MSSSAGRVLLIDKGDYSASVQYVPMDYVYYQGSTYVCKQTSQGNAPTNTTYWQCLAKGASNAAGLSYDHTSSGMTASNVQDAIDELDSGIDSINTALSKFGTVSVTVAVTANTAKVVDFSTALANAGVDVTKLKITNARLHPTYNTNGVIQFYPFSRYQWQFKGSFSKEQTTFYLDYVY